MPVYPQVTIAQATDLKALVIPQVGLLYRSTSEQGIMNEPAALRLGPSGPTSAPSYDLRLEALSD